MRGQHLTPGHPTPPHPRTQARAAAQEATVAEVASLLGVSAGSATLLLRSFRWNQEDLLTRYMEDPEAVCRAAGVAAPSADGGDSAAAATRALASAPAGAPGGIEECSICREELTAGSAVRISALECGHPFCDACWGRYLDIKVESGDTQISCPAHKCALRVPEEMLRRVCAPAVAERYKYFLRKSYVEDSRTAVWCPVAGCSLAVDTSQSAGGAAGCGGAFFTCASGHSFCALCSQEAHAPAACAVVKAWLKKCDDDSETFNWLSLNTQDCPACKSTIEKNGGWCACGVKHALAGMRMCHMPCAGF
jgi:ariadne-1